MHITFDQKGKKIHYFHNCAFSKTISCSQTSAGTRKLSALSLQEKLNLNGSARQGELSAVFFSFTWTPAGNWKDLTPGGRCRNGAWKVLTMWPAGAGSPARCRRAWRSCAPRRCGPSEGCRSLGPFDWGAPGTWCVRTPSSAPEESRRGGVTGQDPIQMDMFIAIWLRMATWI